MGELPLNPKKAKTYHNLFQHVKATPTNEEVILNT